MEGDRNFRFLMCIPCDKTFPLIPFFKPLTLTLEIDLLLKNFNLGHNFWMVSDRALIFHMCIPCDKTFPWIPKFLTLWPWPWRLTYLRNQLLYYQEKSASLLSKVPTGAFVFYKHIFFIDFQQRVNKVLPFLLRFVCFIFLRRIFV